MLKKFSAGIFALMLLALPSLGNAAAVNLSDPGDGLFNSTDYTLGWEFTANTDISVTSLGQFDFEGDGLSNDADIAIWESNGTLVASTTIAAGTSGTLIDYFRYVDISPVLLSAGQSYIIASYIANDQALDLGNGAIFTVDPAITVLNDRFDFANSLVFPTEINSLGAFDGWFGPNFQFTTQQVSEPGMLALLGLSLTGFAALRRRKSA
ncbi:DUF4082 domain-containing protein [Emcibacter sp.]|uniref:DUF4082 domain-containing protein n=1 Tax=Emcibacter sp. TaxID=1979954 RepID=UPI003A94A6FE